MIFSDVTNTVGNTPLVRLGRIGSELNADICVKLESRNPCGSVKDRVALALVEDAEKRGVLEPQATLVEPTSGNTGIGLAFVAAAKGYRLILTMPERISQDRIALLKFLGAQLVLTPGSLMRAAVEKAREVAKQVPGAVMLQQFNNQANPEIHRQTTAQEILRDTDGKVDVLVAGVGTGGTITGVGEVLKERNPDLKIIAVEPAKAAVLSGRDPGQHFIPGLGAGFVPEVLNRDIIDRVVPVTEATAFAHTTRLAREEGISVGISSGAALAAALHSIKSMGLANKRIVVIMPDRGERYVGNPMFTELMKSLPPT